MTLEQCLITSEYIMSLRSGKRYVQRSCRWARHEGTGRNGGVVPPLLNHGNRWGEYWASHPCRFSPGEGGWIPQPMWTFWRRDKFLTPAGIRTGPAWSSSPWRSCCTESIIPAAMLLSSPAVCCTAVMGQVSAVRLVRMTKGVQNLWRKNWACAVELGVD